MRSDSGIPAEHGVKDVIEIGQIQGIRHGDESDDHWVNVAENRIEVLRVLHDAMDIPRYWPVEGA